ncbi:MAG: HAD-IA family hydrolase [Actinobacteria bacterium]|nr:HAD-IA family hydrolase [Actinomycetota bacterium]
MRSHNASARMDLHAVIMDFDGIVVDTEGPIYLAWAEQFEKYDIAPPSMQEWALEIGTIGGLDLVGMVRKRASAAVRERIDPTFIVDTVRKRRDDLLAGARLMPGVLCWLDDAKRAGIPLAVASSSGTEWVRGHLDSLGILDRFDWISCANQPATSQRPVQAPLGEGLRAKPAPDTYLDACRALAVEPSNAMAVEDSPNGIAAAKSAGLKCLAVPHDLTRCLDLSEADSILESLASRTLHSAASLLGFAVGSKSPSAPLSRGKAAGSCP